MRIRICFSKTEAMRFTGHLDLHRTWERIFRRAGLPLAYSQGFHPQPRLNLACALPLGCTSQGEVLDAWLEDSLNLDEVNSALLPALPPGITMQQLAEADSRAPVLQTQVQSAEYIITLLDTSLHIDEGIQSLLNAQALSRERRGKAYDLRPLIEDIQRLPDDPTNLPRYQLRLAARPGATGRPDEVLAALGVPLTSARIHRSQLIFCQ